VGKAKRAHHLQAMLLMDGGHGARAPLPILPLIASADLVIARSESDEAIHLSPCGAMDCFAPLAITA
jgi:uncharacterized heparinase superfamily protein